MALAKPIEDLIAVYTKFIEYHPTANAVKIHVDEIAAKIALFYEKIRNIIDYQEEHSLREKLILRVVKRRLLLTPGGIIAEAFIKDIIRSGHLKNDSVPEDKIKEIQEVIDSIRELIGHLRALPGNARQGVDEDWLIQMLGNTIEERLFPPIEEQILFELMYQSIKPKLVVHGADIPDDVIKLELCIAIQRALFRVDEDRLMYRLLTFIYPTWGKARGNELVNVAHGLAETKQRIEKLMHHETAPYFLQLCNRHNTTFFIIGDIVKKHTNGGSLRQALENDVVRHESVVDAYHERYRKEKSRLRKLALFSVISFLISKIAVALAVEIPIEIQLTGAFSWFNTFINISIPPLIMLITVMMLRMPSEHNVTLVRRAVDEVIEGRGDYVVVIPKKKSWFWTVILHVCYIGLFIGIFYGLWLLMYAMGFHIANTAIFILFMSLVIAAGVKINNRAKELSLEEERATFGSFIIDIVVTPFMILGQWLIRGLSYFNIVVLIINLFIELPFQFVIEFLENFRGFLKYKKEELR